jgi:hypothetical protein
VEIGAEGVSKRVDILEVKFTAILWAGKSDASPRSINMNPKEWIVFGYYINEKFGTRGQMVKMKWTCRLYEYRQGCRSHQKKCSLQLRLGSKNSCKLFWFQGITKGRTQNKRFPSNFCVAFQGGPESILS